MKKIFGRGAGPSSFGRKQRISEITIGLEPIIFLEGGGTGQDLGACAAWP